MNSGHRFGDNKFEARLKAKEFSIQFEINKEDFAFKIISERDLNLWLCKRLENTKKRVWVVLHKKASTYYVNEFLGFRFRQYAIKTLNHLILAALRNMWTISEVSEEININWSFNLAQMILLQRMFAAWRDVMDNKSDPRTTNWFMMSSPLPTVMIILCYIGIAKVQTWYFIKNYPNHNFISSVSWAKVDEKQKAFQGTKTAALVQHRSPLDEHSNVPAIFKICVVQWV